MTDLLDVSTIENDQILKISLTGERQCLHSLRLADAVHGSDYPSKITISIDGLYYGLNS